MEAIVILAEITQYKSNVQERTIIYRDAYNLEMLQQDRITSCISLKFLDTLYPYKEFIMIKKNIPILVK